MSATAKLMAGGPVTTDEDYYLDRARRLLNSPRLTCWWWSDLLEPSGEEFITSLSAGATYAAKSNACGVGVLNTGVPGASTVTASLYPGNEVNALGNSFPGGSTGVWYIAARYKLTGGTVQTNYQNVCQLLLDSNNSGHTGFALAGMRANGASTKWVVQYSNAEGSGALDSSADVDANTHVHEFLRTGGVTYYYLDESLILSSSSAYPTGACYAALTTAADPPAAAATITNVDWLCFAVGGNNPRTIT